MVRRLDEVPKQGQGNDWCTKVVNCQKECPTQLGQRFGTYVIGSPGLK
jgi:hypothetical protein